jgi:hypothetical protein
VPAFLAGLGIDSVEIAVPTADVDDSRRNGRRRPKKVVAMHWRQGGATDLEPPCFLTGLRIHCIEIAIIARNVNDPIRERWARSHDITGAEAPYLPEG